MEITELQKEDETAWYDYVYKSNSSTFYHQIGWKNAVEKTYKHKPIFNCKRRRRDERGFAFVFDEKHFFSARSWFRFHSRRTAEFAQVVDAE